MKLIFAIFTALGVSMIGLTNVHAAPPIKSPIGYDISYPQCNTKVSTNHAFGIVGVNGGLATTPNPCLEQQLEWASTAVGGTKQEKVQLYVNTANPGGLDTPSWPQDNFDPGGNFVVTPHGGCTGEDTLACAWQYGWNRAYEDVNWWFGPAATKVLADTKPSSYVWWLDVELENTWKLSGSKLDYQSNVAVLEGMAEYFASIGTRIGLYSTAYQWGEITDGVIDSESRLNGLPNWRPGGRNVSTATQACTASPLTPGGTVVLTQYIARGLDHNYSCIK